MYDAQEGVYCMVTGIRYGGTRGLLSRIDSFEIKVNGIFVQNKCVPYKETSAHFVVTEKG